MKNPMSLLLFGRTGPSRSTAAQSSGAAVRVERLPGQLDGELDLVAAHDDPVRIPAPLPHALVVERARDELAREPDLDLVGLVQVHDLAPVEPERRAARPLGRRLLELAQGAKPLEQSAHAGSEKPPSTISVWPQIIAASSEQRNATA